MSLITQHLIRDNMIKVKRPNLGDCWNVALALAVNKEYDEVRRYFSRKKWIGKCGGAYLHTIRKYALLNGYTDLTGHHYKTVKGLADDTQYTDYEYIAVASGHVVYVRYGVIYDSNGKDLIRVTDKYNTAILHRKINKRRKPVHEYLPKGGLHLER